MEPKQMVVLLVAVSVHTTLAAQDQLVTVKTQNVEITGKRTTYNYNIEGGINTVDSFFGIPYAVSPVGDLRFKDPVAIQHPRAHDGTKRGAACLQSTGSFTMDKGVTHEVVSEDCLWLNIYTPYKDNDQGPYDVMAYIHGGFGRQGSGNWYDGHVLAQNGVVVVMINYRVGLFGYLTDGNTNSEFHGDYGTYDQVAALQWIKNNIRNFRGDPTKVTIFGNDFGSQSVELHLLMKQSKGLFHRAILQSGVLNKLVSYAGNGRELKVKFDTIAADLKCTGNAVCLRNANGTKVTRALGILLPDRGFYRGSRVLPDDPATLIKAGRFNKVPVMIGTTPSESARYFCGRVVMDVWKRNGPANMSVDGSGAFTGDIDGTARAILKDYTWRRPASEEVVKRIIGEYFPDDVRADPIKVTSNFLQLESDFAVIVDSILLAKHLRSQGVTPYYYVFDNPLSLYVSTDRRYDTDGDDDAADFMAPYHEKVRQYCKDLLSQNSYQDIELPILFGMPITKGYSRQVWHNNDFSDDDRKLSLRMMKLWTDFAKHGNPTPTGSDVQWSPFNSKTSDYLSIKAKGMEMKKGLKADKVKFWKEVLPGEFL